MNKYVEFGNSYYRGHGYFCPHNINKDTMLQTKESGRYRLICNACKYEAHLVHHELVSVIIRNGNLRTFVYKNAIHIYEEDSFFPMYKFNISWNPLDLTTVYDRVNKLLVLI